MNDKTIEDSGGSCNYYKVTITDPWNEEKPPYEAECGEISEALDMNPHEANVFKEVWRKAAARQGRRKKGNNPIRSAEKIKFFADRILLTESRDM
jgi:hypothetical protein